MNSNYEHVFEIEFIKTGYKRTATYSKIKSGQIKDHLDKTILNIGYLGEDYVSIRKNDKELCDKLNKKWRHMLERCYDKTSNRYYCYGAVGVTVSDRWLCFSNYYNDVINIKNFNRDKIISGDLTLDKDMLQQGIQNKVYSKETCIWLTYKDQANLLDYDSINKKREIKFYWEYNDQNGISTNIKKFAKEHNLKTSGIHKVLKNKLTHHHGYKFKYY